MRKPSSAGSRTGGTKAKPRRPRAREWPSADDLTTFQRIASRIVTGGDASYHTLQHHLGLEVSRISRVVKRLEGYYGTTLILRHQSKNLSGKLTREGLLLLEKVSELARHHEELSDPLILEQDRVLVVTTTILLTHALPAAIERFLAAAPGARLSFREYDIDQIIALVASGEVDCGIGPCTAPDQRLSADVLSEELPTNRSFVFICHPDHPCARLGPFPLKELERHRLITLSSGLQPEFAALPAPDRAAGGERLEVMSYATIVEFVRRNLGVGVYASWMEELERWRLEGSLHYRPLPDLPYRPCAAYLPARRALPAPAHQFLDIVRQTLREAEAQTQSIFARVGPEGIGPGAPGLLSPAGKPTRRQRGPR
jgi:DNA-binding transcriptional LysR family regulator